MLGEQRALSERRTGEPGFNARIGPEPQTAGMTSAASSGTRARKDAMGNTIMGTHLLCDVERKAFQGEAARC
jgi:hypothetical protein